MSVLVVADTALAEILAACEADFPIEACGLLLGDAARHVTAIVRGRNLDASPHRFVLDPSDFLRADGIATDLGLEIVGSFHSHPGRSASPSLADEVAAQAGWSHVIVSVGHGGCEKLRSWALEEAGSRLVEERVIVRRTADQSGAARRSA